MCLIIFVVEYSSFIILDLSFFGVIFNCCSQIVTVCEFLNLILLCLSFLYDKLTSFIMTLTLC